MTDKTYTHAGTSLCNGEWKARFANDALRVKVLAKTGHTHIDLVELPRPMLKLEAIEHLIAINHANGDANRAAALDAGRDKRIPKPPKVPKTRDELLKPTVATFTAPAATAATPGAVAAAAIVPVGTDEDEDAPF